MPTDKSALAELLFPNISKTPADYFKLYPKRNLPENACVTRFAPSPTGFLHIGGLYSSLASERCARLSGGRFMLRIEDTDKKREQQDGVLGILNDLAAFGVSFDEGVCLSGETGNYGPYTQSLRGDIYASFAKAMVAADYAYPCFMTEDELAEIRVKQEKEKLLPGCYGKFAKYRDIDFETAKKLISEGKTFVVRLKSRGSENGRVCFDDLIKGQVDMPENILDIVILKSDGLPTYHFAHAVDDTLMRVTNVVRGDEWLPSAPIHIELFSALASLYPGDVSRPKYAHIAPILKEDNGTRRKISKRKDPEAAVSYFLEKGYPVAAVHEYLMTLLNSDFEMWREQNPSENIDSFPFSLSKMSVSGALFDLKKLDDISKALIASMSAEEVAENALTWAKKYDDNLYSLLSRDKAKTTAIFSIDRGGDKPRKDITKWEDIKDYVSIFFDELFTGFCPLPENISKQDAKAILDMYVKTYNKNRDKSEWFAAVKEICAPLGFASEVKTFKKNPEQFKGHIGDVSGVIRIAVTGRRQTPDLASICAVLGEEKMKQRIAEFINKLDKGEI